MTANLIHDRGRGPEIVGTRITVYNLLSDFLDPTATEAAICRLYELTAEQVAAARAYVLNHADTVLSEHLRIEERMAAGNPPEVIEQAKRTHEAFLKFKDWLVKRAQDAAQEHAAETITGGGQYESRPFPTFREWLTTQEARPGQGS